MDRKSRKCKARGTAMKGKERDEAVLGNESMMRRKVDQDCRTRSGRVVKPTAKVIETGLL